NIRKKAHEQDQKRIAEETKECTFRPDLRKRRRRSSSFSQRTGGDTYRGTRIGDSSMISNVSSRNRINDSGVAMSSSGNSRNPSHKTTSDHSRVTQVWEDEARDVRVQLGQLSRDYNEAAALLSSE
ncbi:unnamed protein product, partial [Amoebophrya sp. A25]